MEIEWGRRCIAVETGIGRIDGIAVYTILGT